MIEQTFAVALYNGTPMYDPGIKKRFEAAGLRIVQEFSFFLASIQQAQQFYAGMEQEEGFHSLCLDFAAGRNLGLVLKGEDAVEVAKNVDMKNMFNAVWCAPTEEVGHRKWSIVRPPLAPELPVSSRILTLKPLTSTFNCTIWKGPADGEGLEGKEEHDEGSLLMGTFDAGLITRANLQKGTASDSITSVHGDARLAFLANSKMVRADARFAQTLLEEKGQETLRSLYHACGVEEIEFLGTILRDSENGQRSVPLLFRSPPGGEWYGFYDHLNRLRSVKRAAFCLPG